MLEHPAAAKLRSHIMEGEWTKVSYTYSKHQRYHTRTVNTKTHTVNTKTHTVNTKTHTVNTKSHVH